MCYPMRIMAMLYDQTGKNRSGDSKMMGSKVETACTVISNFHRSFCTFFILLSVWTNKR